MFLKCLLLLLYCSFIGAQYFHSTSERCPYPHLDNGIARVKQRLNFVKFSCRSHFILMGNKYATCRNGHWDVQLPICIKPGCEPLQEVKNSIKQSYHNNAWVLYFCLPGHSLEGSQVLYCDGNQWNSTIPKCVDSSVQVKTSCDFEDRDLCGWKQDEFHDFDWRRLNKRTPSSFLLTGPQFDHTYGKNGNGYYMYIESTSRLANDTARLISPVMDKELTKDGCFVFYYHMYGRSIGGLRVYQKPDRLTLNEMLQYSENGTNKYMLFEQWGNQGNVWYTGVSSLLDVEDDFQIVIEGIRGRSFMSDIAIDDVAIQQGDACVTSKNDAISPPPSTSEESCVGRCSVRRDPPNSGCDCTFLCVVYDNCCPDYLDVCEFGPNGNSTEEIDSSYPTSTSIQMPQTQKLIATTTPIPTTLSSTTISTTTSTTKATTTKATTTRRPTTLPTTRITTTTFSTTKLTTTTSTVKPTTLRVTEKAKVTIKNPTTTLASIDKKNATTSLYTTQPPVTQKYISRTVKIPPLSKEIVAKKAKGSNAVTIVLLTLLVLCICAGALYGATVLRGARGAEALVRMRARRARDPEVRFLKSDDDDVDE